MSKIHDMPLNIKPQRAGQSIREFCESYGISKALYYKLPLNLRPAELRIRRRVIITSEAASEWRQRMTLRQDAEK